jgi:hypothetical protein
MKKILYFSWIGMWIVLGLPIVIVLVIGIWLQKKYQQITCKKCLIK